MAGERPPEDPDGIPTGVELTALDATFRAAAGRRQRDHHRSHRQRGWLLLRHQGLDKLRADRDPEEA
jgi:hypothetical protein